MLKTLQFYLDRERETEEREGCFFFFFFLAEHNTMSTRIQNQLVSKQIIVITGGVGAWSMEGGRRCTKIEIGCMLRIVMCFIYFFIIIFF